MAWRRWLASLPKVELHLHLEGAIPHEALLRLVQYYGDPRVRSAADLAERFRYEDFDGFLATWHWKNRFLRSYDDFAYIAEAVASDLAAQNVRYAEVFYSPRDFEGAGLQLEGLTEAVRAGLDRIADIEIGLICDLVRDQGADVALDTVARLERVAAANGVVGIGLGGSEASFPPELFADAYRAARQAGLRVTAHAGEAAGPASVWGALRSLEVERVGHGIRSIEDPALVEHLAARRIPLEVCPLSNLATGVVADLAAHPIRRLHDAGVLVTVSTDDPAMFGNTLVEDLAGLMDVHAFTPAEIQRLVLNAVDASWLPAARRRAMSTEFVTSPGWLPPPG